MRVLIVDNFDSFTHNLAQVLGGLGAEVVVRRNDQGVPSILATRPARVVLSPGPGGPEESGCCRELLLRTLGSVPVLGVCLGMQVIAAVFGGRVGRAPAPLHGKDTPLRHDGRGVFRGLPQSVAVGRYHSLVVDETSLPAGLVATAWSDGLLMGLRHAALPVEGVQFHPESVLTPAGPSMLANFLRQDLGAR